MRINVHLVGTRGSAAAALASAAALRDVSDDGGGRVMETSGNPSTSIYKAHEYCKTKNTL